MSETVDSVIADSLGSSSDDDLILVSNRQPYRHRFEEGEDGRRQVVVDRPTGGLVAGLDPVLQRLGGTWIAWSDGDADEHVSDEQGRAMVPPDDPAYTLQRVQLDEDTVRGYYNGFANQALWPLCHTMTGNVRYDRRHWEHYRAANERFAAATAEHVTDDATVWFQDYHLALAPKMLRERSEAQLMQFWHIPWPAVDVFRTCPYRRELLEGLLANDLLGFHVGRYCANFLECVEELVPGAAVDPEKGMIRHGDRLTRVESFPLGIDVDEIREFAEDAGDVGASFRRDHDIAADRRLVVGVDRLDYTKGIPERLEALERLWETRPEMRGEFTYVQKASESRTEVPAYRRLRERVALTRDRINRRFGTVDWQPVVIVEESLPREELYGLYRAADVGLVTPLRDGMNLVAQEYVAAQVEDDGALVLSEFAGAHQILGENAYTVNPYDTDGCAEVIERALTADEAGRRARMRRLRERVASLDLHQWIASVLEAADGVRQDREIGPERSVT